MQGYRLQMAHDPPVWRGGDAVVPLCATHHGKFEDFDGLLVSLERMDQSTEAWSIDDLSAFIDSREEQLAEHASPSCLLSRLQKLLAAHRFCSDGLVLAMCAEAQLLRTLGDVEDSYDLLLVASRLIVKCRDVRVRLECQIGRSVSGLGFPELGANYAWSALSYIEELPRCERLVPYWCDVLQTLCDDGQLLSVSHILDDLADPLWTAELKGHASYGNMMSYGAVVARDLAGDFRAASEGLLRSRALSEGVDVEAYIWREANLGLLAGNEGEFEREVHCLNAASKSFESRGFSQAARLTAFWLAQAHFRRANAGHAPDVHLAKARRILMRQADDLTLRGRSRLLQDTAELIDQVRRAAGEQLQDQVRRRPCIGGGKGGLLKPPRPGSFTAREWASKSWRALAGQRRMGRK